MLGSSLGDKGVNLTLNIIPQERSYRVDRPPRSHTAHGWDPDRVGMNSPAGPLEAELTLEPQPSGGVLKRVA